MRQAQYDRYGKPEVLSIREVDIPDIKPSELLVKVHFVGLNPKDAALRNGFLKQLRNKRFPKLTGFDFSGEVVQIGSRVSGYQPGDKVFGYFENLNGGAAADYAVILPQQIAPTSIDSKLAASMPCAYLTAWQAYQQVKLKEGQRVLIYGASGGVGTAAIQLAKHLGTHVTAVSSSKNQSYCLQHGANEFIAYNVQDPFSTSDKYDVFFQVHVITGDRYNRAKDLLSKRGKFITLSPNPLKKAWNLFRWKKVYPIVVRARSCDLRKLNELVTSGALKPVVSQTFALEEVQKAHIELHTQHTRGKIVLAID